MTPGQYDFSVVRGNSGPLAGLVVQLQSSEGQAIPFVDVRLSIYKRNDLILRHTVSNGKLLVTDEYAGEITWSPEPSDTRLIPKGAKATYELEVWNGLDELTYLFGTITGLLGINDDEDVS